MSKKLLLLLIPLLVASCSNNNESVSVSESNQYSEDNSQSESSTNSDSNNSVESNSNVSTSIDLSSNSNSNSDEQDQDSLKDKYQCLDIKSALALVENKENDYVTPEKQYVYGTIKSINNVNYGEMTIQDDTGELYVYGIEGFSSLEDAPVKGDEIVLQGVVHIFNGKIEFGKKDDRATLVEFRHVKQEVSNDYVSKSIFEARKAPADTKLKITGVVSQKTYANDAKTATGVYVSDNTSSIYVYSRDVASQVEIGNTITVAGEKDYYILESEKSNAKKYNYIGSNQLKNSTLLENDKKVSDFDASWAKEKTIKEIKETPFDADITNEYYKVNALIKKSVHDGYNNYHFYDFDGKTGSYAYTLANGKDFEYLDAYDGKLCTLYLTAINAKSTDTGCVYRFMPIKILSDNYTFDTNKIPSFALEYYVKDQFDPEYKVDPDLECYTSINNDIIPFENVAISYESSNEDVAYFTTSSDGKVNFHTNLAGKATITMTATYNGQSVSVTKDITVVTQEAVDYITVKEAIDHELNQEVYVKGIVGPGVVNQRTGFHLIDETGVIPVLLKNGEEFEKIARGNEVIIKGLRTVYTLDNTNTSIIFGQSEIYAAEVVTNLYGNHDYSTASFDNTKTVLDLLSFPTKIDYTTQVFTLKATIFKVATNYYTNYYVGQDNDHKISLYASDGKTQYSWLNDYVGQEVDIEIILCNYNSKDKYKGCLLSITVDGTKIYNPNNFKK